MQEKQINSYLVGCLSLRVKVAFVPCGSGKLQKVRSWPPAVCFLPGTFQTLSLAPTATQVIMLIHKANVSTPGKSLLTNYHLYIYLTGSLSGDIVVKVETNCVDINLISLRPISVISTGSKGSQHLLKHNSLQSHRWSSSNHHQQSRSTSGTF